MAQITTRDVRWLSARCPAPGEPRCPSKHASDPLLLPLLSPALCAGLQGPSPAHFSPYKSEAASSLQPQHDHSADPAGWWMENPRTRGNPSVRLLPGRLNDFTKQQIVVTRVEQRKERRNTLESLLRHHPAISFRKARKRREPGGGIRLKKKKQKTWTEQQGSFETRGKGSESWVLGMKQPGLGAGLTADSEAAPVECCSTRPAVEPLPWW